MRAEWARAGKGQLTDISFRTWHNQHFLFTVIRRRICGRGPLR